MAPDSLSNKDLAPTALSARTWGLWNIAALWVAMSVCIPTYMLAASMVAAGLNWRQSLLAVLLGNLIVLVPLVPIFRGGCLLDGSLDPFAFGFWDCR